MLVSLPFAWLYLLPSGLVDFSKSILYSLGFSSNFYFHYSGQIYGAESGLFKPFLHTWSLSVEEQFYIFFPIILLTIFKYFRKHLLIILVIGLIISLQMAGWFSKNYSSISFYFIHTRMWELLAGSILAYFEIKLGHRSKNKTLNLILPSVGLFLIGHYILFFNDKMFHPSFFTLSPIIGVCLIIWFSSKDEIIKKILSTRLFVGVGLISYSLYLWHYPIFAFARIKNNNPSGYDKFEWVVLSIILSLISYFFVEKLFRNKKYKIKPIIILIIFFLSGLILYNLTVIKKEGFKERIPKIFEENFSQKPWLLLKDKNGKSCHNNVKGCRFDTHLNKKIFLIGDSHMESIMYDLKKRITPKGYQFITYTSAGCLYFPGFDLKNKNTNKIHHGCDFDYFEKLKKILLTEKDSIIIFGGRFPLYLTNNYFNNLEGGVEGTGSFVEYISRGYYDSIGESFKNELLKFSNSQNIILVYPIPEVGWNSPLILFNSIKKIKKTLLTERDSMKKYSLPSISTSFDVYKERTKTSFKLLNSIKNKNIFRIYPHKLFCNNIQNNRCIINDDKNIFYSDTNHPSIKGAEMINDLIMKEIEKIEIKSN